MCGLVTLRCSHRRRASSVSIAYFPRDFSADSGTSLTSVPPDLFQAIGQRLGATSRYGDPSTLWVHRSKYQAGLPDIIFDLEYAVVKLTQREYLLVEDYETESYIPLALSSADGVSPANVCDCERAPFSDKLLHLTLIHTHQRMFCFQPMILGDNFMRRYTVIFDYGTARVGVAPPKKAPPPLKLVDADVDVQSRGVPDPGLLWSFTETLSTWLDMMARKVRDSLACLLQICI